MVAYAEPSQEGGEGGEGDGGGGIGTAAVAEGGQGDMEPAAGTTARGGVESSTSMSIINRLRLYPIALVVCWSWATANRVREAIEPYSQSLFWLYILQYTFQVRAPKTKIARQYLVVFFNTVVVARSACANERGLFYLRWRMVYWHEMRDRLIPGKKKRSERSTPYIFCDCHVHGSTPTGSTHSNYDWFLVAL